MVHRPEGFWRRPLSKRASRVVLLILPGGLIFFEGWLGRKRLFGAHDLQYQLAFILFAACAIIVVETLRVVAARARKIEYQGTFSTLQVWTGVLACLGIALFGIFSDYTLSTLNKESVFSSVFTGVVLGVWNAASIKKPTTADGN